MFWKSKDYEEQFWRCQNNGNGNDWKHIRTRLYFTSASHIYSLLHLLTLGNDSELIKAPPAEQAEKINRFVYMSYLSHIEFRLYENLQMEPDNPNRFRVEVSIYPDFSKGCPIEEGTLGANGFTIDQIQKFITSVIKESPEKV
jgi:inositol hexakisphosphate/diphosphoinositol-pentakisphosphate kinase